MLLIPKFRLSQNIKKEVTKLDNFLPFFDLIVLYLRQNSVKHVRLNQNYQRN